MRSVPRAHRGRVWRELAHRRLGEPRPGRTGVGWAGWGRRGQNAPVTPSYPLSLLSDGATWRGRALSGRTLDLLAALAGCEGARMGDDAIIEALWPADPPAHPLRALHVVVSRVRALVGDGVVERVGDGYRLALATSDVDARDLAARAARARACAATGGLIANTHAGAKRSTDGNFVQRDSNTTCDGSTYPDFDQQFRVKTA